MRESSGIIVLHPAERNKEMGWSIVDKCNKTRLSSITRLGSDFSWTGARPFHLPLSFPSQLIYISLFMAFLAKVFTFRCCDWG